MTDELTSSMADDFVEQQLAERSRSSALVAPKVSGDDMAKALNIAGKKNMPPLVVADDLPNYTEQEDLDAVAAAARANPGFGIWLQKPENVAIAKDDLKPLSDMLSASKEVPTGKAPIFYAPPGMGDGSFTNPVRKESWDPRSYEEIYRGAPQGSWVLNEDGSMRKREASTLDLLAQFPGRVSSLLGSSIQAIDTYIDPIAGWLSENIGGPKGGGVAEATIDALRAPSDPTQYNQFTPNKTLDDVLEKPSNFGEFFVQGTLQSLPDMFAAGANWKLYALARDREIAEQRALNNQSGETTIRDQAIALPAAVIESTLEKFATGRLGVGATGGSVTKRLVQETAVQGGTEFIEEGAAYLGETAGTDRGANITDFGKAGLGGLLLGGPLGTATQGVHEVYGASIKRAETKWVNAARAVHDQNYLDNVIATSQQSKLLKRSPEKFEELLQAQVGDAQVFVPVEDLQALYQSENLDPAQAVTDLTGDMNAWNEAYTSGGAVAIPLARYVSRLSDAHAKLGKNARLNPDSALDEVNAKLPTREEIQADIEKAMTEARATDERDNGPSGRVYDDIYGQLLGRTDEKSARQQAAVIQSVYRNLGERVGIDAYTLSQRFKINIGTPKMPAAGQSRGVDTAIDPLIAAARGKNFDEKDIYGGSLIPTIIKLGGINPQSVGGGDLVAQAAHLRPGLLNLMGMTTERMGEKLSEVGFNAFSTLDEIGRPDYRELLELIQKELLGEPVYSQYSENDADSTRIMRRESFRRDAELVKAQLSKYAMETGKDLDTLTPQELRDVAMQAFADETNAEALDQPAYHGTPHKVDKFSLHKIGTGEGAQAYGWGLYFAESKDIAEYYRKALAPNAEIKNWKFGSIQLFKNGNYVDYSPRDSSDEQQAKALLSEDLLIEEAKIRDAFEREGVDAARKVMLQIADERIESSKEDHPELVSHFEAHRSNIENNLVFDATHDKGNIYKVEVPESDELIDYEKPYKDQPKLVKEKLKAAGVVKGYKENLSDFASPMLSRGKNMRGENIYQYLRHKLGSDQAASEYLGTLGIKGMKYHDGNSRAKGKGTYNYVIWDESAIGDPEALYQSSVEVSEDDSKSYADAVASGKKREALRILHRVVGVEYTDSGIDRGGAHSAPEPEAGSPAWDVASNVYPEDVYGPNGLRYYGTGEDAMDREALSVIHNLEAHPNRPVTVYRAVEKDGAKKILPGDWVSTVRKYVKEHGESALNGDYKIIKATVYARDIFTAGDSWLEWGYHPQKFLPEVPKGENKSKPLSEIANSYLSRDSGEALDQKRGDKGPRGQITGRGGKSIIGQKSAAGVREFNIQLLAGHDLSTFMHETGHAFLEITADLAEDPNAPQQIRDDWAKTMAWLGVDDRSKIGRDQHEQFARGFEAYLREGKAPSSSLRSAFASFKVWLMSIYKTARSLNVELSDEVRGVFDRLLATDAEIAEAQTQVYHEALITDALAVGMSDVQHEAYQRAVQEAKAVAESEVAAEVLKVQQRAQMAWWREERRAVRATVETELRNLPVYRATRWIRQGLMPDGSPVPMAIKISKESLLDFYGPEFLKNLRGLYSAEGGMSRDEAAALLGYASGGEMIDAIVNAPKLQDVIETDTDRIMAERHPDPLTDGTLPDRAMAAVHSDKQADVMLREIKTLEGFTKAKNPTSAEIINEVARRLVSEKKARDLVPNLYRQAEAKAGRESFEAAAKLDWPAALAARRRQLLNMRLYQEAVRVRAEVESIGKYLKRFTKNEKRAKLGKAGADYLEQIDGLLDRFDFKKMSGPAADRRGRLLEWVLKKQADGVPVDLPPKLLDEAFSKPFKELTIDELRQIRDAVKHLDHLATLKNTLLLNGERRDREAIDLEMAKSVAENSKPIEDLPGEPSAGLAWAKSLGWARATMGAATDVARRLDGYKDLGPVWSHTVGVIRDAVNNQVNPALKRAQEAIAGIYRGHYTKAELRNLSKPRVVPGVPGTWSKGRILALALNWGNEGNREAVMKQAKKRLKPVEIGTLLGTLDERDWAFVHGVWDHVDSYWPEIAESQRRRKGLVPEKVAPAPFTITTIDGKTIPIKGGYYPLKYEADSTLKMREEADEFYDSIRTGRFAKASTKDGHTIERTGSGGRTVQLDLDVLDGHLRNVIRDLYLGDAVNYVHSVLKGPAFGGAISDTGNIELVRGMDLWLRDVATGEMGLRSPAEKTARFIRTNFTASALTYKFVSAALQVTGIIQSSVVLGKAYTAEGVARYGRRPIAMTKYVTSVSPFMASRSDTNIEAVQQLFDAQAGRLKAGHSAMIRWGYFMIARVQQVVDIATWLGAEAKGMEQFAGDVKKARAYADDVVSRAQGSGEFMDKISLQRGSIGDNVRQSEWIRAATTLQGYMITKHNALIERSLKAKKGIDGINAKSVWEGMKWAGDMANLLVIEAIIVAAIRGTLPDDDDDDDGDGVTDEWLSFAGTETMGNLMGGLPGLGSMVTELRGYDSKGIVAGMWSEVANTIEQGKQGELDKAAVKASVKVAGYGAGIPSSQINKTIDAIAAEQDGEDVSPLDYLRGPSK